jgi:hypothetical protein
MVLVGNLEPPLRAGVDWEVDGGEGDVAHHAGGPALYTYTYAYYIYTPLHIHKGDVAHHVQPWERGGGREERGENTGGRGEYRWERRGEEKRREERRGEGRREERRERKGSGEER